MLRAKHQTAARLFCRFGSSVQGRIRWWWGYRGETIAKIKAMPEQTDS